MQRIFRLMFARRGLKRAVSALLCGALALMMAGVRHTGRVSAGLPIAATPSGNIVNWRGPVTYTIDQGPLGSLSNAEAVALVNELFGVWKHVPTVSLDLQQNGQLSQDVTAANYLSLYRNRSDQNHPIIFDTDGSIIDAIYGSGAHTSILGFGVPSWTTSSLDSSIDGAISDADAVLNGAFIGGRPADTPQLSIEQFKATFVHEFGHFLGVGHSQLNIGTAFDRNFSNDQIVPLMFPFSLNNQTPVLTQDDKAQITRMYPSAAAASTTGNIRGRILLPDGVTPFQGANVIARRIDDPLVVAVSSVSGYRYRGTGSSANFGSTDSSLQGLFEINSLPPGNYTVEVEPIYQEFIGGSGVGPLDPPIDLPGPAEYYSGAAESASDGPATAAILSVSAGQTLDNINIILNSSNSIPQISETASHSGIGTAQAVSLPRIITGSVSSADPGEARGGAFTGVPAQVQDFFSFTATAGDWVTLDLNWPNPAVNLDLYLYDGSGTRLASSYTCSYGITCGGSFNPTREQIGPFQVSATGTYFIGVSSRTSTVTNYTLEASYQRVSIQNNSTQVTTVSAANYQAQAPPESIVAAFGTQLAPNLAVAASVPLPTSLGGVTVTVNGNPAGLFFVSPNQVNYQIPAGTAAGTANVVVTTSSGVVSRGTITVSGVAPSLFTANSDGQGAPAALVLRVRSNGQQIYEPVAKFDSATNKFVPATITRAAGDQLFLVLFGTGLRNAPNADNNSDNGVAESVQVTFGGTSAPVLYAAAAPGYVGLDQVNVQIPNGVSGSSVTVIMKVNNGQGTLVQANPVTVALQ
ncbi:MAG TPA: pre-peptidase C-terminal domain-containing protein [Blastocatellia bacterium]|nr:pre-peptidase C-terminal domain-containing protein [Blastocatellia bacterium]